MNLVERELSLPGWLERLWSLLDFRRRPAWDMSDLTDWHPQHRTEGSGVWAVRPPCGYGLWTLYRPGSQPDEQGFSRQQDVVEVRAAADEFGGDNDRVGLADVRWWMELWVAGVAGAPVVEMVEGWSEPYGPERDHREYVIYVRTGRS